LGSAFSLVDLATVADRTALGLATALTEAIRTGVLRDDGAHLRFRHDLIRDAIYEDLPGSVRQALHHEAGQRLAHAHAPALLVAEHLARGAGAADAEAVTWLTRAAREAAATSPDVAADLLERAIGLMDPAHPGRDRLLAEQASSLMWAGRITAAKEMCRTLLERTHTREAEGPARLCLGYALVAQSQQRDALPELERAAKSPALTDAERAGARAWAGYARLSMADLDGASATAGEALSAAPADHLATSVAMATHAPWSPYTVGTWPTRLRSSMRRLAWLIRAQAGRVTAFRSMPHEGSSLPSSTGSMKPDPRSTSANGSARSSGSAGTCPTTR
jgi:hypothetical protein